MSNETGNISASQLDTPVEIIVASGKARSDALVVDLVRFKTWLHETFAVLEWERIEGPPAHYQFAIDHPLDGDPAFQVEGLIYEGGQKDIAFGRATPRFAADFLAAFVEQFPENTDIVSVVDDRIYARFDASLANDDAAAQLLSHDAALEQNLTEANE